MKKRNLLMIFLFVLVILLGGYIVYDKLLSNNNEKSVVPSTNDNGVVETNDDSNEETNHNEASTNNNLSLNLEELSDYRNYEDKSYGDIEYYYAEDYGIRLYLSADGKVRLLKDNNNDINYISNIDEVIDITELAVNGDYSYYFLTKKGEVYSYNIANYNNGDFSAKKENGTNINKIVHYRYSESSNSGVSHLIIAISNNGDNAILNKISS